MSLISYGPLKLVEMELVEVEGQQQQRAAQNADVCICIIPTHTHDPPPPDSGPDFLSRPAAPAECHRGFPGAAGRRGCLPRDRAADPNARYRRSIGDLLLHIFGHWLL